MSNTRNTIRFYLDGKLIMLCDVSPTLTVLQYLRDHLHRTGTKEGCAEGDCGACTVVVAELQEGKIHYRAINACIHFVPLLDGKILFTVESLKTKQGLHPIQQAMVDCHASQCGFCTPGFVMSLFALYKTANNPSHEQLCNTLSGNLCRCTGYRPILAAGQRMYQYADALEQHNPLTQTYPETTAPIEWLEQLQSLQQDAASLAITYQNQRFFAPRTVNELSQYVVDYPDARILAGGTDIGLWVTKQQRDLTSLIYLGQVAELHCINSHEHSLEIGAAVNLEQAYQALVAHYPELQELHQRFASLPIRNAGTLVGNIANGSPIGDSMPALIALGATIVLRRGDKQRETALEDFYLGYQQKDLQPSEFVQAVRIPRPKPEQQLRVWKISKRFEQDISAVCAAFCIELEQGVVKQIRIAFGGMAAISKRAKQTEAALLNQTWTPTVIERAQAALAQDFSPLSDMRASAHYRLSIAQQLLYKFYLQTSGSKVATELGAIHD